MPSQFLSTSQTFIGVLTTIVLLCIISGPDTGNFLYAMVSNIIGWTKEKVYALQSDMVSTGRNIHLPRLQEEFTNLRVKFYGSNDNTNNINSYIEQQTFLFLQKLNTYSGRFSKNYSAPAIDKLQEIEESNEQTYSPLYVFGYCILVFLCDELFNSFPASREFICRFVTLFTVTSTLYLGIFWFKFYRESKDIPSQTTRKKHRSFKSYFRRSTRLRLLIAYMLPIVAWVVSPQHLSNWTALALLFGYSILLSATLAQIGKRHTAILKTYGSYRYSFLFFHFIILMAISMIGATLFGYPFIQTVTVDYSGLYAYLRLLMVFFIILFGLTAPLLLPYIAVSQIYKYALKSQREGLHEIKAEWQDLRNWLRDFESECERLRKEEQIRIELEEFQKLLWYY